MGLWPIVRSNHITLPLSVYNCAKGNSSVGGRRLAGAALQQILALLSKHAMLHEQCRALRVHPDNVWTSDLWLRGMQSVSVRVFN